MAYEIKNFENLLGLAGFSDQLLKNHFTLYSGYVNNFNKLNDILVVMEREGKYAAPEYAELNRRLGWEFNGMRLHEFYFGNLTKTSVKIDENFNLFKAILKEFGSYDFFEKDFKAMAVMRGIGWIILYYDKQSDRLFNVWVNEHDAGHFSGCVPLLVMDVFEHAYMLDYGIKRADYIEAFMKVIDWKAAENRYAQSQ
ncbi:superoxide dismutase [Candidatus Wolfebacteria bacterium]|nr:superoxide dismutase [Candidatus Wolfebacteria bacterium]